MSFYQDICAGTIDAIRAEIKRLKTLGQMGEAELFKKLQERVDSGKTMLHVAVSTGRIDIVRLLLNEDIVIDSRDDQGHKAVDLALQLMNANSTNTAQYADFHAIAAMLRTRENWLAKCKFRFHKVVAMIAATSEKIAAGKDQQKVLVLGCSRIGKSSFINYAHGTRYVQKLKPQSDERYLECCGGVPEIAATKPGPISETLYPQVISIPNQEFVLCDLAGFIDSRGPEKRICATSGAQILTRLPGDIKAIAAVLALDSFSANADEFKKTLLALNKIVRGDVNLFNSIYFIITKAPEGVTAAGICHAKIIPILEDLIEISTIRTLTAEEKSLVLMLSYMRDNQNRILIPNVCDQGESYQSLKAIFSQCLAKPAAAFDFTQHDQAQEQFNQALFSIASDYVDRKRRLEIDIPAKIANESRCKLAEVAKVDGWRHEIQQMHAALHESYPHRLEKMVADKRDLIAWNEAAIADLLDFIADRPTLYDRMRDLLMGEHGWFFHTRGCGNAQRAQQKIAKLQADNITLRAELLAVETALIQAKADYLVDTQRIAKEIAKREVWINGQVATDAQPNLQGALQQIRAAEENLANLSRERHELQLELQVNQDLFMTVASTAKLLQLQSADLGVLFNEYSCTDHENLVLKM